jgi:integrase
MPLGVDVRHGRACRSRTGGRCNCTPRYQAHVFDALTGRRLRRTFDTLTAAKLWRQDAQVALRRGTMRVASAPTLAQAAHDLVAGMADGSVLDRGGRPYKPSTIRSYEASLRLHVVPLLGGRRLGELRRRDVQAVVDRLRGKGLSPSTVTNTLDPLRVICRRALRDDLIAIDPTDGLELPAIRGRRDRIETPEQAHRLLTALPPEERALWSVALFAGLRRGELRALRWRDIDLDAGVIRVERGWDQYAGPIEVKTDSGRRAVPVAFVVRRELRDHKLRTGRDGDDLVFGRTATEAFYPSTIAARARKAWRAVGVEPLTLHEARHCAISYFIAAGLDWKQISTWAGHGDVRQTWNRYGHLVPGGEQEAAALLSRYLEGPTVAQTVAQPAEEANDPAITGPFKYRYRDSNPGFRRERAAS